MAYEEALAARIRELLSGVPNLTEKSMFGGLAFLVGGNMAVSVRGRGGIMVRVAPEESEPLTAAGEARMVEMRGRAMRGWLSVDANRVQRKEQLELWVRRGLTYASSLPPKR